jgi:uncharacterized protein (TIGR02186 family)
VVAITTGFSGTDLLLFGVTRGEGDLVVVVRGPEENPVVRRKENVGGIWINQDNVTFVDVPAFYSLASNRSIDDFVPSDVADIHQIGLDEIIFKPHTKQRAVDDITAFSDAVIRIKQREGLYSINVNNLIYLGNGLFRTLVHFPANVSVGTYGIDVYLFNDGKLIDNQTTLLNVRKFGLEAGIFNFAHRQSALYGVFAVLIAAFAGWLANVAFRKG